MNLNEVPKTFQAACLYIGRPVLEKMGIKYEMKDVYRELQVGHSSSLQQVRFVLKALFNKNKSTEVDKRLLELQQKLRESSFLNDIYKYQVSHPNCWSKLDRHQMTDDFKELLLSKKDEHDLSWAEVSRLLNIPEDTLRKLKGQNSRKDDDNSLPPPSLPEHVVDKLSEFFKGRSQKATVKDFCEKDPDVLVELNLEYRVFSKLLLRLGYVSPKGIFLPNKGLDLIKRFAPNVVWGTDGKNMNIVINGESFRWVWQCLIDYKTTILVGGVINESETTENLLEAIKRSSKDMGVAPMAIVLDNRLSENLPAIQAYLNTLGVEIIKTFPGNSKSNGIIENNFRVFENWMHGHEGKIIINAEDPKELSRAIAKLLTEVFTQLRNQAPRKSLFGKSAADVARTALPLTDKERSLIADEIKALANRFKNELATPIINAAKEEALRLALEKLNPPSPEVFLKRLGPSYFTAEIILQALAIYQTQKEKYPEKTLDHTYFGGILRNLVDQENLRQLHINVEATYQEFWNRMDNRLQTTIMEIPTAVERSVSLIKEFLFAKIPAQGTLVLAYLKNLFFYMAGKNIESMTSLRKVLVEQIEREKMVALDKREILLRKLYEFESFARSIAKIPENIFKNGTQVFSQSFDQYQAT